jgi:hypothetical protein
MYQKLNFNSAKITMTSLVQPVPYAINPGKASQEFAAM